MKRLSLLAILVIALMALAPLPALASGGGGGGGDGGNATSPSESAGFNNASGFFALFFQSGGNLALAAYELSIPPLGTPPPEETWAEQIQRRFVERVVKERARREAERQARQDERDKAAENRSDDDLPGLDY